MKQFFFLFFLFSMTSARAYIENRGIYPLGESEAQMANTGLALRGSSGSAFFNPAGLASLRERKLSLTGNTYMQFRTSARPMTRVDGEDLNLSASAIQVIPSSLVSTWTKGPWTYAFGVYVPELLRTNFVKGFSTTRLDMELSQSIDDQFLLVGLSAGGTLADDLDIGYSCYVGQYQATNIQNLLAKPKAGSGYSDVGIVSAYSNVEARGLLCQGGIQKRLNPEMRLGAVLRLPFMNLSGTGRYSSFTQDLNGGLDVSGIQEKAGKYSVPLEVGVGLVNDRFEKVHLLADVNYQMPEDFEAIEGAGDRTQTREILRWSFGVEYDLEDQWRLRGGYGYNPSAMILKKDGDTRENFQVLTLGTQFSSGPASTGLGIFYANSRGENRVSATQLGKVESNVLAFILNTGFVF